MLNMDCRDFTVYGEHANFGCTHRNNCSRTIEVAVSGYLSKSLFLGDLDSTLFMTRARSNEVTCLCFSQSLSPWETAHAPAPTRLQVELLKLFLWERISMSPSVDASPIETLTSIR